MDIGARVRFRHPLVRSAVYRAASPEERRRGAPGAGRGDRRRTSTPTAAPGICAAGDRRPRRGRRRRARARRPGARRRAAGSAAAAAFLERAAALTPDPARRAQRALAAAQTKYQAGALDDGSRAARHAEAGPLDELQRARVDLLRAQIAFAVQRAAATPRRSCWRPPAARATRSRTWRATTYLEALDGGAVRRPAGPRRGRRRGERRPRCAGARRRPRPPRRPISCSTGWRRWFTDGLRRGRTDPARRRWARSAARPPSPPRGAPLALARLPHRVRTSGTTRPGGCSPRVSSERRP